MNDKAKPTIDGRPALFAWIDSIHPNEELTPLAIQKAAPAGFAVTEDATRGVILHGPYGNGTTVPSMEGWGGSAKKVKGLALLQAIAGLVERGPRWWSRSLDDQANYWRQEIKTADPIMVEPKDELSTRAAMEDHLENCRTCEPASTLLAEAISLGSTRYSDGHVRQLIEKAHADQAEAVQFYTALRDAHRAPFMSTEKPSRKRTQEVPA